MTKVSVRLSKFFRKPALFTRTMAGREVRTPPEEVGKPATFSKACEGLLAQRQPAQARGLRQGSLNSPPPPLRVGQDHPCSWSRQSSPDAPTPPCSCGAPDHPFLECCIRFWGHWRMGYLKSISEHLLIMRSQHVVLGVQQF